MHAAYEFIAKFQTSAAGSCSTITLHDGKIIVITRAAVAVYDHLQSFNRGNARAVIER